MCVIIYVPKESNISKEELRDAWTTNPDGAGFSIQKDNKVVFKRGFMTFMKFEKAVTPLIGKYNLLLHFRISTSNKVNKIQTHPYKKGNVTLTQGMTTKPVICMNGVISKQKEYLNCNDTMSYIIDHNEAFANINQDVLNIIETATGAKWAVMTPEEVLLSSRFEEENGKFYSNKNHLLFNYYYTYSGGGLRKKQLEVKDIITNKRLRKSLAKDWELYQDVNDYITFNCSYNDECDCTKCLKSCKTLREIKIMLLENWYDEPIAYCSESNPNDYDYNDYDYDDFNSNFWKMCEETNLCG